MTGSGQGKEKDRYDGFGVGKRFKEGLREG